MSLSYIKENSELSVHLPSENGIITVIVRAGKQHAKARGLLLEMEV